MSEREPDMFRYRYTRRDDGFSQAWCYVEWDRSLVDHLQRQVPLHPEIKLETEAVWIGPIPAAVRPRKEETE